MIARLIALCGRQRFLVITGAVLLVLAGLWAMRHIPLDALPDISDVEVIVHTSWPGQPPSLIEDQVTYPIASALLGAPKVKAVRAQTMFGDSYVFVIFQDGTDLYWARSRVLEYLQQLAGRLPAAAHPVLGPDATGAGWVFEYVVVDPTHRLDLAQLRSLQDWYLRYQLESVPGVAEIATIGGFVREYQVALDPDKLRAYGIPLATVIDRVRASSQAVGGRLLEMGGAEYMIRGLGYLHSLDDLREVPVAVHDGTPVLVGDLGTVSYGPEIRRGAAEWDGRGPAVGGIVVMRAGENALRVIGAVKAKLAGLRASLPAGVEILPAYDRSGLIRASVQTLTRDLIEEAIIVSLVILVFLLHFRSALIPILTLPIAVIATFLPMYWLHISSNIMSLGGLALAIGVLVDAGIVMVENAHRRLAARQAAGPGVSERERRGEVIAAAQQVGAPIFYSLLVIVASFLPVFLLEAQEGRMFRPLAWTKTLAVGFSSLLAITLVPVLLLLFVRGRLREEGSNPISRFTQALYLPLLGWCLRHRRPTLVASVAALAAIVPLARGLGSEFMPSLFEGSALYMPTALPGISITQATRLLSEQDRILRSFPEVASVFGTVGRSDSATDNAPLDMFDTTIMLKPRREWPAGTTYARLIRAMDQKLQFPGLTNTWTMPVENRLDMELTGIKTPVGMKIQGPSLAGIERAGAQIERLLAGLPEVRSAFAERVAQGFYLNIDVDRAAAARYGLTVAAVQQAIESGIGGADIGENIEGRARYPINVRYERDFRDNLAALRQVLVATPSGAQIPLAAVARLSFSTGPAMIRDEEAQLTGYLYLDLATHDYGGFVARADRLLRRRLHLPPGYAYAWAGQYRFELRAEKRLELIGPVVIFLIFLLLYLAFRSAAEAALLSLPIAFGLIGGLVLQRLLGYEFSVAVWVGYIALFGIVVETAVVMMIYLREATDATLAGHRAAGSTPSAGEIEAATIAGAVLRLRPKLMTVVVVLASLLPVLWSSGIGSDVMKPIAAPIVGGMVTSPWAVLILVPVLYDELERRRLRRGRLVARGEESD